MKHSKIVPWLVGLTALAVVGLAVLFVTRDAGDRQTLWLDVGKALLQLVVVGVVGTALKLLADAYQAGRERAVARTEFRADKYRRLVDVTGRLRAVPIFIRGNQSVKTWSEQMPTVLAADAELRQIKHEIYTSGLLADAPFPDTDAIVVRLEAMFGYTSWVASDFAKHKKRLGEAQRVAEGTDVAQEERARRQQALWDELKAVPSVADMIAARENPEAEARTATQPSWKTYLEDEGAALELILDAALAMPRRGPRSA